MAVFTQLSDEDRVSITAAYGMTSLTSVIGIAKGSPSRLSGDSEAHENGVRSAAWICDGVDCWTPGSARS
jgi:hypothetical protein